MLRFCGSLFRNLTFLKNKWRIGSAPGLLLSQEGEARTPRGNVHVRRRVKQQNRSNLLWRTIYAERAVRCNNCVVTLTFLCLYALTSSFAPNYASIIRQDLIATTPFRARTMPVFAHKNGYARVLASIIPSLQLLPQLQLCSPLLLTKRSFSHS